MEGKHGSGDNAGMCEIYVRSLHLRRCRILCVVALEISCGSWAHAGQVRRQGQDIREHFGALICSRPLQALYIVDIKMLQFRVHAALPDDTAWGDSLILAAQEGKEVVREEIVSQNIRAEHEAQLRHVGGRGFGQRVDSQARHGSLRCRARGRLYPALGENLPGKGDPADVRPPADACIENHGVETWDLDLGAYIVEVDRAVDKLLGGAAHGAQITQVELDRGDVHAGESVVEVAHATVLEGLVGRSGMEEVFAQAGDGLGGFGGGSRCGEEDEVRGQWAFREEGIDYALANAQADATRRCWWSVGLRREVWYGLIRGAWLVPVGAGDKHEEGVLRWERGPGS